MKHLMPESSFCMDIDMIFFISCSSGTTMMSVSLSMCLARYMSVHDFTLDRLELGEHASGNCCKAFLARHCRLSDCSCYQFNKCALKVRGIGLENHCTSLCPSNLSGKNTVIFHHDSYFSRKNSASLDERFDILF